MTTEIRYSGIAAQPSDYDAVDGSLSLALNAVVENDAVRPLPVPAAKLSSVNGDPVYIHKTASFTHFIATKNGAYLWCDEKNISNNYATMTAMPDKLTGLKPTSFQSIGNVLMLVCSDNVHYVMWADNTYKYLGTHLPELPIVFTLSLKVSCSDKFGISQPPTRGNDSDNANALYYFADTDRSTLTQTVLGQVNKYVAAESTNSGRFMFPFMVRYAFRLFDGSLTMHSSPVLLRPCIGSFPYVTTTSKVADTTTFVSSIKSDTRVIGVTGGLQWKIDDTALTDIKNNWSSLVKSVDIFISAPLYTYDQAGEVGYIENLNTTNMCFGAIGSTNKRSTLHSLKDFGETFTHTETEATTSTTISTEQTYKIALPSFTDEELKDKVLSCSTFYLLKSVPVSELSGGSTLDITVPDDYLQSLTTREVMTDDYDSHDTILPSTTYVYNSRLNFSGITKVKRNGFASAPFFPLCDDADNVPARYIAVRLEVDGVSKWVVGTSAGATATLYSLIYASTTFKTFFYYPDTNAKELYIITPDSGLTVLRYTLTAHDFLNGAVCYEPAISYTVSSLPTSSTVTQYLSNKIYTSEVNNPFYYPVANINTVGAGKVLALASTTQALSEGQFGQFPMYAFTDEGVWALEVSTATGGFSSRQPVCRDVLLSSDGVCQSDGEVFFTTERGVMVLSGSKVTPITDTLIGAEVDFSKLAGYASLLATMPQKTVGFLTYLASARMMFDYIHQRLHVYNPAYTYAYVFSLTSKQWGMTTFVPSSHLNAYPKSYALMSGNMLYDLSTPTATCRMQVLVTRPFKYGDAGLLKTVTTILQRGTVPEKRLKMVLYGSRDLTSWHAVASSATGRLTRLHGTPYKFFRLLVLCEMTATESLSGFSSEVSVKYNNRLR